MTDNSEEKPTSNGEPAELDDTRRQDQTETPNTPRSSQTGSQARNTAPGRKPLFRT